MKVIPLIEAFLVIGIGETQVILKFLEIISKIA